ncbi:hypothetical protein CCACVL1_24869, partial [Corchorus capsularis]
SHAVIALFIGAASNVLFVKSIESLKAVGWIPLK